MCAKMVAFLAIHNSVVGHGYLGCLPHVSDGGVGVGGSSKKDADALSYHHALVK